MHTPREMANEISELRAKLAGAEAALDAIRSGEVDALVNLSGSVSTQTGAETAYISFFEVMNEGGVTLDNQGIILHANNRFSEMAGLPIEKLRGNKFVSCISSGEQARVTSFLSGQSSGTCDSWLVSPNGSLPVGISVKTVDTETLKYQCLVLSDLSDRVKTEAELRIAAIAFESQEGMAVTDPNAVIVRVNQAFGQLTGYSAEEVVGKKFSVLKSGRHDSDFYSRMWSKLKADKFWQGAIWDKHKNGKIYAHWLTISAVCRPDGEVSHYVGSFSEITKNKEAEAEVHRLAYYDALTQLPNRRLFQDRLTQTVASNTRSHFYGALMFLDLDNFKTVNDTRGHDIGDLMLIEVAKRLRDGVRAGDTVARLGGDEFVVLLEDLGKELDGAALLAEQIGKKFIEAISRAYSFDGVEFHNTTSIGVALFSKQTTAEDLFKQADLALYQAKAAGRNALRFFDAKMQEAVNARAILEDELRNAIEQFELEVLYQPIVDCDSGKIYKAEALLRWKHPTRGIISPATFIPLAEESGLIVEIGEWVFMQALNAIEQWKNETGQIIQVSVNKSPVQFIRAERHLWLERLAKTDLPKECIAVEITEGILITDSDKIREELLSFQKQGIEVSLDDFGTGFSALSYLNQFDIDYLKIDISFIRNIVENESNRALTEAIIVMAHKLGIKTIAEGVETEAQKNLLIQFGCDYIQGFLYSKPVIATEFIKLLKH